MDHKSNRPRDLDEGANAESVTRKLQSAFEGQSLDELSDLLSKYFDPEFPREEMEKKFRPLTFWATMCGYLEGLIKLVEEYHCKLDYVEEKSGQDLLHIACSKDYKEVAKYLVQSHKFDPNKSNKAGVTPLFAASSKGHLDMVTFLIEELKCDPTTTAPKDVGGDSLLHAVCKNANAEVRKGEKNVHLEVVRYLSSKHNLSPEARNTNEETPLHVACSRGSFEVAQYLVEELHCQITVFDNQGFTPLHNACRNGYAKVVSYLLEKDADTTCFDNSGSTPLQLACCTGRSDVVKVLLASGKVDPNATTLTEHSTIEITRDVKTIKELIKGGAKPTGRTRSIMQHYRNKQPLNSLVHIYVIGYELSGKTTLVQSLQVPINAKAKFFKYTGISSSQVRDVVHRTAGIVPIEFDSPDFGNVMMFDFAGQFDYHASHEALLEYSKTTSAPIFLLVVNMAEGFNEVVRKTRYWITFILRNPVSGNNRPHVIMVASHVDRLEKNSPLLKKLEKFAKRKLEEANLICDGFFPLDCRDPFKQNDLRHVLKTSCQALRNDEEIDVCCHVLRVFLIDKFNGKLCCKIEEVIAKAKDSDYPLPIQADRLCELAEAMSARTKTLFLRNHRRIEKSWIVLDIDTLLQEVNGRIFAPKDFPEHTFAASSTGTLRKSELTKQFPQLDPDMLVAFLRRLEFCQVVSDPEILGFQQRPVQSLGSSAGESTPAISPGHVFELSVVVVDDDHMIDDIHKDDNIQQDGLPVNWRQNLFKPTSTGSDTPPTEKQTNVRPSQPSHSIQQNVPASLDSGIDSPNSYYSPLSLANSPLTCSPVTPDDISTTSCSNTGSHEKKNGNTPQEYTCEDTLLFFPGLIKNSRPDTMLWDPEDKYDFYTGWCLECTDYAHIFGQRFLTCLHLRLESCFAVKNTGIQCTKWKNGIRWLSLDGIETIVEVVKDGKAVLLLMRVKEGHLAIRGLRLRSAVIRKVLETKKFCCSQMTTSEFMIDECHLKTGRPYPVITQPLRELARYDMRLIAQAFRENGHYVWGETQGKLVELEKVVCHDPYLCLDQEIVKRFYSEDDQDRLLEQDLLFTIARKHHEKTHWFSKMLFEDEKSLTKSTSETPVNQFMEVLERYRLTGATLGDFRRQLDKYSLFAGRMVVPGSPELERIENILRPEEEFKLQQSTSELSCPVHVHDVLPYSEQNKQHSTKEIDMPCIDPENELVVDSKGYQYDNYDSLSNKWESTSQHSASTSPSHMRRDMLPRSQPNRLASPYETDSKGESGVTTVSQSTLNIAKNLSSEAVHFSIKPNPSKSVVLFDKVTSSISDTKSQGEFPNAISSTLKDITERNDNAGVPQPKQPKSYEINHGGRDDTSLFGDKLKTNISYIDPIETVIVSNKGIQYTNNDHGFCISVPQDAISADKEKTIQIDVSVSLSSALTFPPETQPVSPILGLCVVGEPQFAFLKPVEITLPHYLELTDENDIKQLGLCFVKAKHDQSHFSETDGEAHFELRQNYASLKTNHFCYFCVKAKKKIDPSKVKYSVVKVTPRVITSSTWSVIFCITYFLSTCLRAVKKQFSVDHDISVLQRFRFPSTSSDGTITIQFDRKILGGWHLALESNSDKIFASEVQFWAIDQEELELMEAEKLYPPRFKLTVTGMEAHQVGHAHICFNGASTCLATELLLKPIRQAPFLGFDGTSVPPTLDSEPSHIDLMNKVASQVPTKWRDIGLQLGLSKTDLDIIELDNPRNSNKCFSTMFDDWKRKACSPYTWSTVIRALEAPIVCENRLARDLRHEFCEDRSQPNRLDHSQSPYETASKSKNGVTTYTTEC